VTLASVTVFLLAMLSAVAGFGGGVLLLPVFTALFGLRVAMPGSRWPAESATPSWPT
jgi:uncharacterized membrane protein YfcA